MKKLKKVSLSILLAVVFMLLLTVKASAVVDANIVTNEIKSITFDGEYYLNSYPDLKNAFGDDEELAYEHFLLFGIKEGRCAKLTFDVEYYLNNYKDLKAAFGDDNELAFKHLIEFGASEGRTGCRVYDTNYYLSNNADVKKAYGTDYLKVYEHYAVFGVNEGRQASPEFNVKCYLKKYADLKTAFTEKGYAEGFKHYLTFGIVENRIGTHEYKEVETVPATCKTEGYIVKECVCGDTIKTIIPTLEGHDWNEGEITTNPTCTDKGIKTYTCNICQETKTEEIPELGHDYEYIVSAEDETKHVGTCKNDATHVITEDHVYGETKESETLPGIYEATCEKCGYVKYYANQEGTNDVLPVSKPEDLETAITSAEDGDAILLTSDVTLTEDLSLDKAVTLNIGTNTLDMSDKIVAITSNVTITGEGTITSSNAKEAVQVESATLTIDGANIVSEKLYGVLAIDAKIVINDGTVTSKDSCIASNNMDGYLELEINGGVLTAEDDAAIYAPSAGTSITVNDGTINGGISARMGTITINGGTINSISSGNDLIEDYYNFSGNVWLGDAIACMAGTYGDGTDNGRSNDLTININGGTINGLCSGCSAVTIYNLGKTQQNITVNISENANLNVSDKTQPAYKVVSATEIVPSNAKDYATYTAVTNVVNETVPEIFKTVAGN